MTGKVNTKVINTVKKWVEGGAKDKLIANAFKFSVATVQNIKKTGYDYDKYRALVNKQLDNWSTRHGRTDTTAKTYTTKDANFTTVKTYLDEIVKRLDLLTERFDSIFPKVNKRGTKANERNNSNLQ